MVTSSESVSKMSERRTRCNGIMGVPITFLDKYDPEQFIIVGATESEGKGFSNGIRCAQSKITQPVVRGERKYKRIFIMRKVQRVDGSADSAHCQIHAEKEASEEGKEQ